MLLTSLRTDTGPSILTTLDANKEIDWVYRDGHGFGLLHHAVDAAIRLEDKRIFDTVLTRILENAPDMVNWQTPNGRHPQCWSPLHKCVNVVFAKTETEKEAIHNDIVSELISRQDPDVSLACTSRNGSTVAFKVAAILASDHSTHPSANAYIEPNTC